MNLPLFLIGAGFNRDAQEIAGPIMGESIFIGRYQIHCGYPLLNDLWQLCFPGVRGIDLKSSIERHFQLALERSDWEPFKRLYLELMKADYYLVPALLNKDRSANCYAAFFEDFHGASFVTFNYDSLPEGFLYRSGNWYPHDGYGLPVEADSGGASPSAFDIKPSSSLVLHLHGSLCVFTSEFEIIPSEGMDLISPLRPQSSILTRIRSPPCLRHIDGPASTLSLMKKRSYELSLQYQTRPSTLRGTLLVARTVRQRSC